MKTYLRMLSYLRPYPLNILSTWVLSVVIVGLEIVSVWVGATLVEKILIRPGSSSVAAPSTAFMTQSLDLFVSYLLKQATPFRSLLVAVGIFFGAQACIATFRVIKLAIFTRMTQSVLAEVRRQMFERLTECDLAFYRRYRHGGTASLFLMDVDQLNRGFTDSIDRLFMQPARLFVALGLMAALSWVLTSYVLMVLIVAGVLIHLTGKMMEERFRAVFEKRAEVQAHLVEFLSTVIVARAFGREGYEKGRFDAKCRDLKDTFIKAIVINSMTPAAVTIVFLAGGAVLLTWCGYQVLVRDAMSSSVVIKMTFLLPLVTYPLESLASLSNSVRESLASAKRVFNFLDQESPWRELPNAISPAPFREEIVLKNVEYQLEGTRILKDVSLTIPRGVVMVICGPSGAGKTTILSLLAAFIHCTSGLITVDGADIRVFRAANWRRQLGIVPQDCVLLNATVRENLLYARSNANDAEMCEALMQAGIDQSSALLRDGLDTLVGNRGEMLSGGERQRLTIARALLNNPAILLLDEPTSMLDYDHKVMIGEVIQMIANNRTVIIASHDPYLRKMADLVVELNEGRVVGSQCIVKRDLPICAGGAQAARVI